MVALKRYFFNPFDDRRIGTPRLLLFTEDHLGKLLAAADGRAEYNEAIALTQISFTVLKGTISNEALAKAIRKARTAALRSKRAEVHALLARIEARATAAYTKSAPEYIALFPGGLTAFRKAPIDGLEYLLDALITRIAPNAATLDPGAELAPLATQWKNLRGSQLTKKGSATNVAARRRAASSALRLQLFDNLLMLARNHPRKRSAARKFFSQHLLFPPKKSAD